jgi:hypothetical protein
MILSKWLHCMMFGATVGSMTVTKNKSDMYMSAFNQQRRRKASVL